MVPITDLLSPRPPWELALEALKGLGAQGPRGEPVAEPAAGPDRRLAWQLTVCDGYGILDPREQKRTQRGAWSMGRPVALKRLAEGPEEFPYLTPQDREICACIVREQETSWYNGQERTAYSLAADRALLAAVGHPLVTRPAARDPGGTGPRRAHPDRGAARQGHPGQHRALPARGPLRSWW